MAEFLKGRLLVSIPSLRDPNFFRTVVLMCDHDAQGALGLIVNRPAEFSVADALLPVAGAKDCSLPMMLGGPVEPESAFILHRLADRGGFELGDGVHFAADRPTLESIFSGDALKAPDAETLRLFLGYAGWGAGQLESEMKAGAWVAAPLEADLVFETDCQLMWASALRRLGGRYAIMAQTPLDPELN